MSLKNSIVNILAIITATWAVCAIEGCKSPTQTAYVAESAGYVTLKAAADAYKQYKASHPIDATTDAKIHALYASAKLAELTAIDATESAAGLASSTNTVSQADAATAATATLSDLTAFLKSIGVKL